jgi:hypothetical protein
MIATPAENRSVTLISARVISDRFEFYTEIESRVDVARSCLHRVGEGADGFLAVTRFAKCDSQSVAGLGVQWLTLQALAKMIDSDCEAARLRFNLCQEKPGIGIAGFHFDSTLETRPRKIDAARAKLGHSCIQFVGKFHNVALLERQDRVTV